MNSAISASDINELLTNSLMTSDPEENLERLDLLKRQKAAEKVRSDALVAAAMKDPVLGRLNDAKLDLLNAVAVARETALDKPAMMLEDLVTGDDRSSRAAYNDLQADIKSLKAGYSDPRKIEEQEYAKLDADPNATWLDEAEYIASHPGIGLGRIMEGIGSTAPSLVSGSVVAKGLAGAKVAKLAADASRAEKVRAALTSPMAKVSAANALGDAGLGAADIYTDERLQGQDTLTKLKAAGENAGLVFLTDILGPDAGKYLGKQILKKGAENTTFDYATEKGAKAIVNQMENGGNPFTTLSPKVWAKRAGLGAYDIAKGAGGELLNEVPQSWGQEAITRDIAGQEQMNSNEVGKMIFNTALAASPMGGMSNAGASRRQFFGDAYAASAIRAAQNAKQRGDIVNLDNIYGQLPSWGQAMVDSVQAPDRDALIKDARAAYLNGDDQTANNIASGLYPEDRDKIFAPAPLNSPRGLANLSKPTAGEFGTQAYGAEGLGGGYGQGNYSLGNVSVNTPAVQPAAPALPPPRPDITVDPSTMPVSQEEIDREAGPAPAGAISAGTQMNDANTPLLPYSNGPFSQRDWINASDRDRAIAASVAANNAIAGRQEAARNAAVNFAPDQTASKPRIQRRKTGEITPMAEDIAARTGEDPAAVQEKLDKEGKAFDSYRRKHTEPRGMTSMGSALRGAFEKANLKGNRNTSAEIMASEAEMAGKISPYAYAEARRTGEDPREIQLRINREKSELIGSAKGAAYRAASRREKEKLEAARREAYEARRKEAEANIRARKAEAERKRLVEERNREDLRRYQEGMAVSNERAKERTSALSKAFRSPTNATSETTTNGSKENVNTNYKYTRTEGEGTQNVNTPKVTNTAKLSRPRSMKEIMADAYEKASPPVAETKAEPKSEKEAPKREENATSETPNSEKSDLDRAFEKATGDTEEAARHGEGDVNINEGGEEGSAQFSLKSSEQERNERVDLIKGETERRTKIKNAKADKLEAKGKEAKAESKGSRIDKEVISSNSKTNYYGVEFRSPLGEEALKYINGDYERVIYDDYGWPVRTERYPANKAARAKKLKQLLYLMSFEGQKKYAPAHKTSTQFNYQRDINGAINDAAKRAGIELSPDNPLGRELIERTIIHDVQDACEAVPTAIGWYLQKTRGALLLAALRHPEILFNKNDRFIYSMILAITSNGNNVMTNGRVALKLYGEYKNGAKLASFAGRDELGTQQSGMNYSFLHFKEWNRRLGGLDNTRKFFLTHWLYKDLKLMGFPAKGEGPDVEGIGGAVLGPKIGNGFFADLNGLFDQLTMDRWFMRTVGRITGTMINPQSEEYTAKIQELRGLLSDINKDKSIADFVQNTGLISGIDKTTQGVKRTKIDLSELATANGDHLAALLRDLHSCFFAREAKVRSQAELDKLFPGKNVYERLAEIHRVGQAVQSRTAKEVIAPRGSKNRAEIRSLFESSLARLRTDPKFKNMTMADTQAVLWYLEQTIYNNAAGKSARSIFEEQKKADLSGANRRWVDRKNSGKKDKDYVNAIREPLKEEDGFSDAQIDAVLEASDKEIDSESRRGNQASNETIKDKPRAFAGLAYDNCRRAVRGEGDIQPDKRGTYIYQAKRRGVGLSGVLESGGSGSSGVSESNAGRASENGRRYVLSGDETREWTAGSKVKAIINRYGELKGKPKTPAKFIEAAVGNEAHIKKFISAFDDFYSSGESKGKPVATVDRPSEETLKKSRLFLSSDGKAGFAIKEDGDLVSVFSSGGGVGDSILECAISAGARKLDCFNVEWTTPLYARHGFVPVARVKFNRQYAPKNWDYEQLGEPDVVFMVYDQNAPAVFNANKRLASAPVVEAYEQGAGYQSKALEKKEARNKELEDLSVQIEESRSRKTDQQEAEEAKKAEEEERAEEEAEAEESPEGEAQFAVSKSTAEEESKPEPSTGLRPDKMKDAIRQGLGEDTANKLFDSEKVNIVESVNDLADDVLSQLEKAAKSNGASLDDIEGVRLPDGKIYLFSSKHTFDTALGTLYHELGGHGLEAALNDPGRALQRRAEQIIRLGQKSKDERLARMCRTVAERLEASGEKGDRRGDEAFAYLIQEAVRNGYGMEDRSPISRFLSHVRAVIRQKIAQHFGGAVESKLFGKTLGLTVDDMVTLAREHIRSEAGQKPFVFFREGVGTNIPKERLSTEQVGRRFLKDSTNEEKRAAYARERALNERRAKGVWMDKWFGRDELGNVKFKLGESFYNKIRHIPADVAESITPDKFTQLYSIRGLTKRMRMNIRQLKADVQRAFENAKTITAEMNKMSELELSQVSDLIDYTSERQKKEMAKRLKEGGKLKFSATEGDQDIPFKKWAEKSFTSGVEYPETVVKTAILISNLMTLQTREAVNIGMISEESADEFRGHYLARFYSDGVRAAAKGIGMFKVGSGIRGDNVKARGLFKYGVTVEDYWNKYEGEPGWKIRDSRAKWKDGKLYYWQNDKDGDGHWRPARNSDKVTMWRDWTAEERTNMGEVRNAAFRFMMGYMNAQKDLALYRLYNRINNTEGMCYANREDIPEDRWKEGWVQIPDTAIPKSGGVYKFGAVAGKWVSKEAADAIYSQQIIETHAFEYANKLMSYWKEGKTVLNPGTHTNNVTGNIIFAGFGGVPPTNVKAYADAFKGMYKKDRLWQEAMDAGLTLGNFNANEINQALPPEVRKYVNEGKLDKSLNMMMNVLAFGQRARMQNAYQMEDTFFRYLLYRHARLGGMAIEDAVDYANHYIPTYDDIPAGVQRLKAYIPFISFTYKALPLIAETALKYPWRFAGPMVILNAINMASYAMAAAAGAAGDEDYWKKLMRATGSKTKLGAFLSGMKADNDSLPDYLQGFSLFATPKALRLFISDTTGLPYYFDISNFIPGGNFADVTNQAGGIPWPAVISPSAPEWSLACILFLGKDSFMGKDITDASDTGSEKFRKYVKEVWKTVAPGMAVGNRTWDRVVNGIASATGTIIPNLLGESYTGMQYGKQMPLDDAAWQAVGIKLRQIDPTVEFQRKLRDLNEQKKKTISEFKYQAQNTPNTPAGDRMMEDEEKKLEKKIGNYANDVEEASTKFDIRETFLGKAESDAQREAARRDAEKRRRARENEIRTNP